MIPFLPSRVRNAPKDRAHGFCPCVIQRAADQQCSRPSVRGGIAPGSSWSPGLCSGAFGGPAVARFALHGLESGTKNNGNAGRRLTRYPMASSGNQRSASGAVDLRLYALTSDERALRAYRRRGFTRAKTAFIDKITEKARRDVCPDE